MILTTLTLLGKILLLVLIGFIVFEVARLGILGRRAVVAGKRAPVVSQSPPLPKHSLLVIGDSTALGTGATLPECTLVGRLARDVPDATIVNAAQNAMDLKTLVSKLRVRQHERYDFVMIHIGGIDTISLTPLHLVRRRLTEALHIATSMAQIQVVLISVNNAGASPFFRFPLRSFISGRSAAITALCREIAKEHGIIHIPLYADEADDPLCQNPQHFFSPDGIHPNNEGYGLWYEKIKTALLPITKH